MTVDDNAPKVSRDEIKEMSFIEHPPERLDDYLIADRQPQIPRRRTGVGMNSERINLQHELGELQAKVNLYESGGAVVMLDPNQVKDSKAKNRHELAFSSREYAELKKEIGSSGGNDVPIKVRPRGKSSEGADVFEIVWGRRRNRACLELGLQVAAIVEDMDDVEAFKQMERENR